MMSTDAAWSGTNRSTSATIQPNVLRYLLGVAEQRGADLQPALAELGLDLQVLRSTELRVSYRQGSGIVEHALRLTGDSGLGLAVGSAQHLTAWGLLGMALLASDTVQDAVELGVRYQNLSGAMVVWSAQPGPDGFELCATLPDPAVNPAVGVFLVDEALSSVVAWARHAIGPAFAPRLIEFTAPRPADPSCYTDLFRCQVTFGADRNRCVFPTKWVRFALPSRDPWTLARTVELLDREMSAHGNRQELLEILEVSIARSLPEIPSFAEQARHHSASERTLRRRLAECGTTYEALVDGVRRERVEQLLDRRAPLTFRQVARQVGFADERALRRAVQRWHGMAPAQLREAITAHESP